MEIKKPENNLWLERWKNREIGFDQVEANSFMMKYFERLNLEKGVHVLVPLCGKSVDISWLLSEGYAVTGIELSETAVLELFEGLGITPSISKVGEVTLYSMDNLKIFVGDIFKVTEEMIGKVDAIYDRAALVALTLEWRIKYSRHLREITKNAPQLLVSIEYEQTSTLRSPYSVDADEILQVFSKYYSINLLAREEIVGGFKGKFKAFDTAWLLS
jgi:thiopurine S-methyltransferase